MKDKINKNILTVITALCSLFVFSCQSSVEPTASIKGTATTVKVIDQSRYPIPGIQVYYAETPNAAITGLSPYAGAGVTGTTGALTSAFDIPSSGLNFTFYLRPNASIASILAPDSIYVPSQRMPCTDTTLIFQFNRVQRVNCSTSVGAVEITPISICYKDKAIDTVFTSFYAPNCTDPMTVSVDNFSAIKGATLLIYKASAPGVAQPNPFTLAPGDQFEIGMIFNTEYIEKTMTTDYINVYITPQSASKYTFATFTFRAESKCNACSCPEDKSIFYPRSGKASLCNGIQQDFDVSLSEMTNSGADCQMKFQLVKSFTNSGLRLYSINGDSLNIYSPITLSPGSSLQSLRVRALMTTAGTYSDTAVFSIAMVSANGETTPCASFLRVVVNAIVDNPSCAYDTKSMIFMQPFTNTNNTDTLEAGIGASYSTTAVIIKNTSATCPLIIDQALITGTSVAEYRPFYFTNNSGKTLTNIVVLAGGADTIWIVFKPDETDYDRSNTQKKKFSCIIKFTVTNNPNCTLNDLPLNGIIVSSFNSNCIPEWGVQDAYIGIFLGNYGEIQSVPSKTKDFAIYFDNVNYASQSAQMHSSAGSVRFKKLASGESIPVGGDVRDLANKYAGLINGTAGDVDISINKGDVIWVKYSYSNITTGIKYSYNGIMFIDQMAYSGATNPALNTVCFAFCVGI